MVERINYQALMRATPDLYLILSPDLKILDASDAYLQATMVEREDVVGRYVFDVFPNNPDDPKSSDTQNSFLRSAQIILKYKTPHLMPIQKYDIKRPLSTGGDFEVRYWSPLTFPIFDVTDNIKYLLHRAEDVTELDKIQQLEYACNKRFQLLIENIKDYAIIMLDPEGVITTWNAGAEAIIGYVPEEAIGQQITMIYPAEPSCTSRYEISVAKNKGRYECQGWRIRNNNSKFWAGTVITPIYIKSLV